MQISITLPNEEVETRHFDKEKVFIGRSNQCDFIVTNESLSRQHCLIELDRGNFYITDLGSSNGVYLDGQRISSNTRTSFTTFMQLSVGPMECQVADSDEGHKTSAVTKHASVKSYSQNTLSKIPKASKEVTASKPKIKVIQKIKKKNSLFVMAFFIVFAAISYQYFFNQTVEVATEKVTTDSLLVEKNVPLEFKMIKDVPLTVGDYEALEADKNCSEAAACSDLKLSSDKLEGIVQKSGEYFIYFHESHLQQSSLILNSSLKDNSDALDLAVIYDVLNSQVFTQFQQKKIGQIHVIFKRTNYSIFRVYRFHTKYFTNSEQARLLTELGTSLITGNSSNFWDYAKPIIKIQDF